MMHTLTNKALQLAATELGVLPDALTVQSVSGGFSLNRRAIVSAVGRSIFVKEVDVNLLPDDGEQERAWLQKEYAVVQAIQQTHPELVADWIQLSDDGDVLMMTSYPAQAGWVWQPPQDEAERRKYIDAVAQATRQVETISFSDEATKRLQLQPYFQQKLLGDEHLQMIVHDAAMRQKLIAKYKALVGEGSSVQNRRCQAMIRLLQDNDRLQKLLHLFTNFSPQPEDCFNHCDVRSDNLAYHPQMGAVKLVDWNWASYAPRGYGVTEFLLDMARREYDITPWHSLLNRQLVVGVIGFHAGRSLKPPLGPGNDLRDVQALSAATAYELLGEIGW